MDAQVVAIRTERNLRNYITLHSFIFIPSLNMYSTSSVCPVLCQTETKDLNISKIWLLFCVSLSLVRKIKKKKIDICNTAGTVLAKYAVVP